jgi:hypothetical protein
LSEAAFAEYKEVWNPPEAARAGKRVKPHATAPSNAAAQQHAQRKTQARPVTAKAASKQASAGKAARPKTARPLPQKVASNGKHAQLAQPAAHAAAKPAAKPARELPPILSS